MIIDVSQWQGAINWDKVKPQVEFVILRCTCGTNVDNRFAEFATECNRLGIPFGVYHYMMARTNTVALTEIKKFYNTAKPYKPRFWVLDIEEPSVLYADGKQLPMRSGFASLIRYAYDQLRGRVGSGGKIVYYGGESVYEPYGKLSSIPWDALWIANYSKTPKMAHDLHQYSSKGRVNGISGNVDLNRLSGNKGMGWWTGEEAQTEPVSGVVDANGDGRTVRVKAGTWNIRSGPGSENPSVGLFAAGGEEYEWLATAWNGWLAIPIRDGIGWISSAGAEVVESGR